MCIFYALFFRHFRLRIKHAQICEHRGQRCLQVVCQISHELIFFLFAQCRLLLPSDELLLQMSQVVLEQLQLIWKHDRLLRTTDHSLQRHAHRIQIADLPEHEKNKRKKQHCCQ